MSLDTVISEHLLSAVGMPELDITATLRVGGVVFEAQAVVAITRRERYLDDMFEDSQITLAITPGQYSEIVLSGHENISVTVNRRPYNGGTAISNRYRAVLISNRDPRVEGNIADIGTTGNGEKTEISIVNFQILSPAAYDLRPREVGATFRHSRSHEALLYFLSKIRLRDEYSDDEFVGKIECDKSFDSKIHEPLIIREGTSLLELPDYLQDNYGISQQGIGCFLKGQTWYVFAPYGISKSQLDVPKLTVINAPPSRYSQLERNFTLIGKTLTVLATGETRHVKHSDTQALNSGVGVKFASTDSLEFMDTVDPNPKSKPEDYMTAVRARDYGSGFNRIATARKRHTNNVCKQMTMLALQAGEIVETVWENGSLDLLHPGMPVKFIYDRNDTVIIKQGTLLSAEELTSIAHGGIVDRRYRTNTKLTLFLKDA